LRAILAISLVTISALAISPRLLAHHGDAGYDTSKLVTAKGVVTEYYFRNPHVEILIDVKKDDHSSEQWRGELNSPNIVARVTGWNSKTFKAGDEIVLVGYQLKNGLNVLKVDKVLRPDGTELYPKSGNGVTRF
jgi:Family of unknown function (DUF6152)